jgi:PAS domain S-box-containing protein
MGINSSQTENTVVRTLAQEALHECEERFRILLEALNDGAVIHDKLKIIDANSAFAAMFGRRRHEIIGRDLLEFATPPTRDLILDKLLKSDRAPFEITGLNKNGSTFAVELCSRIIPHRGNRLHLTLYRMLCDPLPQQNREADFKEELGPLFDQTPEAYYLADAKGKFIDVNKSAAKLFGLKKEDIIGQSFLKLNILAPSQITRAARSLALNIFGKSTGPEEYALQRKDGSQIPVEVQIMTVKVGKKSLILGMIRDITEKRKAEKALRRAVGEIEILVEKYKTLEANSKLIDS